MRSLTTILARTTAVCAFGGIAALFTACASAPTYDGMPRAARFASRADVDAGTRPNSAVITSADLARVPDAANAYDAVRFLRPLFLRPRPGASALHGGPIVSVYVNDTYAGAADVLQTIPTNAIERMQYLQRSEALTFAGTTTPGDGFIMVTLKSGIR